MIFFEPESGSEHRWALKTDEWWWRYRLMMDLKASEHGLYLLLPFINVALYMYLFLNHYKKQWVIVVPWFKDYLYKKKKKSLYWKSKIANGAL